MSDVAQWLRCDSDVKLLPEKAVRKTNADEGVGLWKKDCLSGSSLHVVVHCT